MRCLALQPQGSPSPPRLHLMEHQSPNPVPPITAHQRRLHPPMDHPKQLLSPPMDHQKLSLPTLHLNRLFPHILHPSQRLHLTLHPNLRHQKPPYHPMAHLPWLVRLMGEEEGGCRMPLTMWLLPAMVQPLQPGRRRVVEGLWASFNWYALCDLSIWNSSDHVSTDNRRRRTKFSLFQEQADQTKQVTYSVSGDSGFKVNLELLCQW